MRFKVLNHDVLGRRWLLCVTNADAVVAAAAAVAASFTDVVCQ